MGHVYQHVDFKAREMAMQDPQITQMKQQMQQMQQQAMQNPAMQQQLQQMQQQMAPILEDKVAQISSEILSDLAPQFAVQNEDPLVELRKEELDIKAADVDRKASEAQQRIDIEQERLDRNMDMAEDRLETQVDIADMKNDTAQDRLRLQREAQMAKTAENMAKNFFGRDR